MIQESEIIGPKEKEGKYYTCFSVLNLRLSEMNKSEWKCSCVSIFMNGKNLSLLVVWEKIDDTIDKSKKI